MPVSGLALLTLAPEVMGLGEIFSSILLGPSSHSPTSLGELFSETSFNGVLSHYQHFTTTTQTKVRKREKEENKLHKRVEL